LALQKNGSKPEVPAPDAQPSGNIIPMQNAGGASSSTDRKDAHVGGFRSSPTGDQGGQQSRRRQRRQQRGHPGDDRARSRTRAPTVVLPMPLKSRIVNNTTLNP